MNKQKFMINFLNAFFRLFQAHINKIKCNFSKTSGNRVNYFFKNS